MSFLSASPVLMKSVEFLSAYSLPREHVLVRKRPAAG
jgi:hypothetical protein